MPVVPTHPVTTPDPDVLRWVVPDGLLPFTGEVARAPALLQALIDDGTLSSVRVDGGAVLTLLGPGRSWRQEGARVRSALVDALGAPGSWEGGQAAHASGPDDALESAARQIASGSLGSFVNSHAGPAPPSPSRLSIAEPGGGRAAPPLSAGLRDVQRVQGCGTRCAPWSGQGRPERRRATQDRPEPCQRDHDRLTIEKPHLKLLWTMRIVRIETEDRTGL